MKHDSTIITLPDTTGLGALAAVTADAPTDEAIGGTLADYVDGLDVEILAQQRAAAANAERLLNEPVYTHVTWRVQPGQTEAFLEAWNALGDLFPTLPHPPIEVTLIRRADDQSIFHSIGSWRSLADAQSVTDSPEAVDAVARIAELCSDGAPAVYEVVRQVRPR